MEEYDHGFWLLPENCLSEMISKTSIKDACRSSAVSLAFKSASESDSVWDKFLPSDYQEIISRSDSQFNFTTKKELFFMLCDSHILINGGTMNFKLCKTSGKKCYMLRARDLYIAWKDHPNHWSWTSFPESRFSEVAELLSVFWLDIKGKIQAKFLSPKTIYAAYVVYKLYDNSCGFDTVMKSSVKYIGDEDDANTDECDRVYLMPLPIVHTDVNTRGIGSRVMQELIGDRVPRKRTDGWMEIFLGEFYNDEGEGEIEMKLSETDTLNWKRGLILEGIEVRPKELKLD